MKSTNKIKSPLRYPGGKSRAVKEIWKYIKPLEPKTLCSPFFGGGSLEIFCAQEGIKVTGYDKFRPLVDFWQELLENPQRLADKVEKHKPGKFTEKDYKKMQKKHPKTKNHLVNATEFYVLNRTSHSGNPLAVGMAREKKKDGSIDTNPRFTMSSIDRLQNFKVENLLSVTCMDFKKSIKKHKKDLMYLDPPYLIESQLYGNDGKIHKNFDHHGLSEILKKDKKKKWILSYNNIDSIRELYKGHTILEPKWSYSMATDKKMSEDKKSRELLIFSKDIKVDLDENGELLEITYI